MKTLDEVVALQQEYEAKVASCEHQWYNATPNFSLGQRCSKCDVYAVPWMRGRIASLEKERDDVLERMGGGHNEPCRHCEKPCNNYAGDPGQWPLLIGNGTKRSWIHVACVWKLEKERNKYHAVLKRISEWDCLNAPNCPGGVSDLCSDFPWLKELVTSALSTEEEP